MSNLPVARQQLLELTRELSRAQAMRVNTILLLMHRQPAIGRGRRVARRLTPEIIAGVKAIYRRDPLAPQMEVAQAFGINIGRVSEILRGRYDA